MAELVGQRHHGALVARVVEEDVRVQIGQAGLAEGAAAFARQYRGIDPLFLEEFPCQSAHLRRKGVVRVQHQRLGLAEVDAAFRRWKHRRVTVVVVELAIAEQAAFERVVVGHDVVPLRHGVEHGVGRGVADLVCQVARRHGVREVAQPVLDGLFLGRHVEDVGQYMGIALECFSHGDLRPPPHAAVAVVEQRQEFGLIHLLALAIERNSLTQAAGTLVEEPLEGADPSETLFGVQLLLSLRERVGREDPLVGQGMRVASQRRMGENAPGKVVVGLPPLDVEEEQRVLHLRDLFTGALHQRAVRRLGRIHRKDQIGIHSGLVRARVDLLDLLNRR